MCVIFCLAHAACLLPKTYHLLSICTNTFIKINTIVLQCTKCNAESTADEGNEKELRDGHTKPDKNKQ